MIKVLITDDHPVVRQGIRQILEDDKDQRFGEIDEASDVTGLIDKLMHKNYDVIVLDISLPGRSGLDALPDIRKINPAVMVLIVSIYPEEQYALRALKLGAAGYLTKSSAPEELISAILKVSAGGRYITTSLAEKITFDMLSGEEKKPHENLSSRELEVIKLLAAGNSLNTIADVLSLSPKTISTYRERILVKLKLKTTAALIRYALENRLA